MNNFLDFPETIYLDRYLEMNKNITRSKREEVKSLQERREALQGRLKSFQEFGTEPGPKLPLLSVLEHTLQFTRSGHVVVGEADSPSNCAMQVRASGMVPVPVPVAFLTTAKVLGTVGAYARGTFAVAFTTFFLPMIRT